MLLSLRDNVLVMILAMMGWTGSGCQEDPHPAKTGSTPAKTSNTMDDPDAVDPSDPSLRKATFAGGCFWCMEGPFDKLPGVVSTTVGYTGGLRQNPTYEQVSAGITEHAEAVQVLYDPAKTSYESLLEIFWRNINPTTPNRQFADVGSQYRTAIFYHDDQQKQAAQTSRDVLQQSGRFDSPIVTQIVPAGPFYRAEEYHQDYYKKNPSHYKAYRRGSGREAYIEKTWPQ